MKKDMKNGDQACNNCKKIIRIGNLFVAKIHTHKNQEVLFCQNNVIYHSHCFARIRSQLNWNESAESLVGFDELPIMAQDRLKELIT